MAPGGLGTDNSWQCIACRLQPPAYNALLIGHLYRPPLDAVIQGLKYSGLDYLGRHLALSALTTWSSPLIRPILGRGEIVVPVPLHWRRRWVRGYDQTEEIARPLARQLGLRLAKALRRKKATRPQARLDRRARWDNPRGSFVVQKRSEVTGRSVLLVDDVVTTGATLSAAALALRRAGAREIIALAIGRTPKEEFFEDAGSLC